MSLLKTRGIVLHHIKYGDSSIIATIYTELCGRQAFIVNGIHSKKSRFRQSAFQPLSLLNMEIYNKPNRDLQRIKELEILVPFSNIPQSMKKTSLCLFIAELLYRTLYEESGNSSLFIFLFKSIELLEEDDNGIENFHLLFLVKYSRFLGILPETKKLPSYIYFNMTDGHFTDSIPFHENYMDNEYSQILVKLLEAGFEDMSELLISSEQRQVMLDKLIEYYYYHIDKMSEIKSHQILREVFH